MSTQLTISRGRREAAPNRTQNKSDSAEAEMKGNSLHEIFLSEVADIYNAEQQLTKALPRMAKAAHSAPPMHFAPEWSIAFRRSMKRLRAFPVTRQRQTYSPAGASSNILPLEKCRH